MPGLVFALLVGVIDAGSVVFYFFQFLYMYISLRTIFFGYAAVSLMVGAFCALVVYAPIGSPASIAQA